tara:strand:- start:5279 stop:6286 length:1008 start_codon:yes stop_codon:yes gene_type:complete
MSDSKLVNYSVIFIAIVVLVIVLKTLESFLRPFVIAIILTFLFMPLIRQSQKKKIPFSVSVIGILLIFVVLIGLVGYLVQERGSQINDPAQEAKFGKGIESINDFGSKFGLDLKKFINSERASQMIASGISKSLSTTGAFFAEFFLVLLFLIFLIPSHRILIKNIEKTLNVSKGRKFKSVLFKIEQSIKDYLLTKSMISLGTAVVSAIILVLFKSESVFLLAFLFFILNFIPNIGSFVAVAIAVILYALTSGLTIALLWLTVLLVLVQIVFGNILEPKISGTKLKLSPIVILLGLLLWGWIWGIVGMLLAIPLTSIIKIILEHIDSTKTAAKFLS